MIWSSGNGVAGVDKRWFDRATEEDVLGMRALVVPAEEMIWQKAYIMERERFDGADVIHIIHGRAEALDWIVLMHYAPVEETVRGEPPPIYPFLGSSRLEAPIDQYHARAVFHGHAHFGSAEGRTKAGVPVYNVALPLLRRVSNEGAAFRIVDIAEPLETREVAA